MEKGPMCRSFIDHLATLGKFSCLESLSHEDVLEDVELVRSKLERRLTRCDAALEKRNVEIEPLQKLLNEKSSEEMARLRLGFEGAERLVRRLRKQVRNFESELSSSRVVTHILIGDY
ncbi:hypothetical protein Tco_1210514 [Tanacetum coccineum]